MSEALQEGDSNARRHGGAQSMLATSDNDANTIASEAAASETVIEAGPLHDPPTTSTIANDYFAHDPNAVNNTIQYATLRPGQHDTVLSAHPSKPQPSIAGSNAIAPGTIVSPESFSQASDYTYYNNNTTTMRQRDSSQTPTNDADASHVFRPLPLVDNDPASPSTASSHKPYPNQAYAALHNQHYPIRSPAPVLRTRSSHPSHILPFPALAPGVYQSGSRTVGNSPAATPSHGLYSPPSDKPRDEWESPETPGTYASPYLHPTHRQAPKETHIADVDVDPISGRKLINHYEILDELGRGTHGKVKLGRDLNTPDTYVAIKIVERYSKKRRLGKLGNPEDKVKKEVAILKKARHPNIVALLEVIDDPSRKKVYIVLEWVERGTIPWRAKAVKELCMLEARQYERLRGGVDSQELDAEDDALRREVHRRLSRRKHDLNRAFKQARKAEHPDRSIDHFGGSQLESDDDTTSRTSTEPASHGTTRTAVRTNTESVAVDESITPTAAVISNPIDVALSSRPDFATLSQAKDMRQWAIEYLDQPIGTDLLYVPCMTLQNIRIAFRDTLLGLQYLHHRGIIHRDIKPPNLLQTTDHRVKISDFGVSYLGRPVHDDQEEEISESEAKDLDGEAKELAKTVGTPAFYAPELCITDPIDDPPPVTKAIDVWALGITLFCMIFARTPFVDNEYVVMRQIAEEEIYVPRLRLKPVGQRSSSRANSRSRPSSPQTTDVRPEHDVIYEEIGEDLYDLLKRLLIKDPRKRMVLEEVRHHPWVVADLPDKLRWLEETDPSRQQEAKKIEVSKEDLNTAVVPLQFLERMRSGIKKIGDRLLAGTARGRSASSATPPGSAPNSLPASANSSSSTISQDAKRHSLRTDELHMALKASREPEHPLAKSLAASPDVEQSNEVFFNEMPSDRRFDNDADFGAPLLQTMSYDSTARPGLPGRSKTGFSTTGSIRTIKQSDFIDSFGQGSPPSPHIAGTPRALDSPGNSAGLLGSSGRNIFKVMRERSAARSDGAEPRRYSPDRLSNKSSDAHAEPSLAVSEMLVAGRLEAADMISSKTLLPDVDGTSLSTRPRSMMLPAGYRPGFSIDSRKSSTASITSTERAEHESRPELTRWASKPGDNASTEDDWNRADRERMRKLLREANEPPRETPTFDDRTCPPSPDDHRGRKNSGPRRISDVDISHPSSSHENSPFTNNSQQHGSLVSSSSDFGSAVSMSVSIPSIPSVISEASSVDVPDGAPLEDTGKNTVSSHDTIRSLPRIADEPVDDGYNAEEDTALDSDNGSDYDDSDTDSDGGLVMTRRKSAIRVNMLSSSPKVGSYSAGGGLSAALDAHSQHRKQRRGTGLSKSSKKSSRSGSNNTMKKVRTRDSIDERRRESGEIDEIDETRGR